MRLPENKSFFDLEITFLLTSVPKTHETAEHVSLRRGPRRRVHNEAVFDFSFQAGIRKIGALHCSYELVRWERLRYAHSVKSDSVCATNWQL